LNTTPQSRSNKKKRAPNEVVQVPQKTITPQELVTTLTKGKLYNKIEDNFHVNNKKALYLNMKNYYEALDEDVFANLPLTFHVKSGLEDPEFHKFKAQYIKFDEEIHKRKVAKKKHKHGDVSPTDSTDKDKPKEV
jgi:hypothetical protein